MSSKFREFLEEQFKERYKHLIIYSLPMTGRTTFGKKVSEELDGYYLDVLSELKDNTAVSKEIDTFYPNDFFKWIAKYCNGKKFIVVDNVDFLINTWREEQEEIFLNLIEKDQSNTVYLFLIQERKFLFKRSITNILGNNRIINLFDII